jgi:hypothetical protein
MKMRLLILFVCIVIVSGFCMKKTREPDILTALPEGAQAVSFTGEPLFASLPSDNALAKPRIPEGPTAPIRIMLTISSGSDAGHLIQRITGKPSVYSPKG